MTTSRILQNKAFRGSARKRKLRGFTLIELLIAIALLLVVMIMTWQMFSSAEKLYRVAAQRSDVYTQARIALDVIEQDLQRVNTVGAHTDIIVMSKAPSVEDNVLDIKAYSQDWDKSPFSEEPSISGLSELPIFLSFYCITSWFNDVDNSYETGLAQVNYYLKQRPKLKIGTGDYDPSSAYLIRRIIPIRQKTIGTGGATIPGAKRHFEEEVASSVLSVRVWAVNNGSAAYMAQERDRSELYSLAYSSQEGATPMAQMLLELPIDSNNNNNNNNNNTDAAIPYTAKPNHAFTWGITAGSARHDPTRGGVPAALTIEMTIANDLFLGNDGDTEKWNGTIRTVSRTISLPSASVGLVLDHEWVQKFQRANAQSTR